MQLPDSGKVRAEPKIKTRTGNGNKVEIILFAKYYNVILAVINLTNVDAIKAEYKRMVKSGEEELGDYATETAEDFNNALQAFKSNATGKYYDDFYIGRWQTKFANKRYYDEPAGVFRCESSTFVGNTRIQIVMTVDSDSCLEENSRMVNKNVVVSNIDPKDITDKIESSMVIRFAA